MLPGNTFSTFPIAGLILPPDNRVTTPLVDYERGGVALLNTSQGLMSHNWKCWLDQYEVKLQREGQAETVLIEETQITELSFCFDQNMRWSVVYIQAGIMKLRWYDSVVSNYVTTVFSEARNPRMALDDKRPSQTGNSDMILAYLRGDALYYRQQRDRFLTERLLRDDLFPGTKLKNIGMGTKLRMQFELV